MIDSLFPRDVAAVTATAEMWDGALYPEEAACIASAVAKRRREFTAGRLCARAALAQLGIHHHPLRMGPVRQPLWPPGIVGSISHGAERCAAVASRSGRIIGLGLDIESDAPLPDDLVPMICAPHEIAWCAQQRPGPTGRWAKLIFSAKETVFKCVFPLTGAWLEFHDVAIRLDPDARRFGAVLPAPAPAMPRGWVIDGRFAWDDDAVLTGATMLIARGAGPTAEQPDGV